MNNTYIWTMIAVMALVTALLRFLPFVIFSNNQKTPKIIEKLQKDGYNLVPISKLIYKDNYKINHEGRQVKLTETQTEN